MDRIQMALKSNACSRSPYVQAMIAVIVCTAVVGCSVAKDASETRKTTQKMQTTTEEMNKSTQELKELSRHLAKRTDDLESELVNKESYAMVTLNLDNLFARVPVTTEDAALNSESDMLLYAGAAVHSMLFQYWKGDYNEDLSILDLRFKLGIEILLVRCLKHMPRNFVVDVLEPSSSYKAIASLGAKLDEQSIGYTKALGSAGLKNLSLYDVILMGLRNRGKSARTEVLPEAVAMVLKYKREALYMIQLRHNYLPMMVLSRMSDFQDKGRLGRLGSFVFGQKVELGIEDGLSPSSVDEEQLKEWTKWLRSSLETRRALKEMGLEPEYSRGLMGILAGVDFGQKQLLKLSVEKATPRQKLLIEFATTWEQAIRPL